MIHYHKNPRQITRKQMTALGVTMGDLGDLSGITHDLDTDEILTGNQRMEVIPGAMSGLNQPVITERFDPPQADGTALLGYFEYKGLRFNYRAVRGWDDTQRERAVIVANKAGGAWDFDILANEFETEKLLEYGFEEQELIGFMPVEESKDAEPQIDRAEELREKWQVESGQMWQLGEHRLICGDCTDAAVVARVMGGEKADCVFTSPPYAAQREYKIGDFDWLGLMLGMSEQALESLKDDSSILVNLGLVHVGGRVYRYWDEWIEWMEDNGQPLYGWYVWDKLSGLMGDWRGRLAPAHEFIFHFAKQPRHTIKTAKTKYAESGITHYKADKVGLRGKDGTMGVFTFAGKKVNQTKVIDSVIRVQPARGGVDGHPAPFSIAFAETLVEVYAGANQIVYDPFSGSGTTLIACENLSRKCRAIEISPAYVAVALERYNTAFPDKGIRLIDSR